MNIEKFTNKLEEETTFVMDTKDVESLNKNLSKEEKIAWLNAFSSPEAYEEFKKSHPKMKGMEYDKRVMPAVLEFFRKLYKM